MASPEVPFSWRLSTATAGRCGALGDLGCHILSIARYLCGPIEALVGSSAVRHAERPTGEPDAPLRRVENEDHAAALTRFAGGVPRVIETSRVALGRKMDLTFEITGERGALDAIAAGENAPPDLVEAARVRRLCEAILDLAASGEWVQRPEDAPSSHRTAA